MKSTYVAGTAAAAVGVPAASYGVWTLFSSGKESPIKSTIDGIPGYVQNNPRNFGLKFENVVTSDLNNVNESVDFKFETGNCFANFFPGVSIDLSNNSSDLSSSSSSSSIFQSIVEQTDAAEDKAMACAAMQMKKSTADGGDYVFKSELTAKNGNIGWSLETGLAFSSPTDGKFSVWNWKEYIVFLKKENEQWKVVGGLFFGDSNTSSESNTYTIDNFKPDGESDWFTDLKDREYLGFWTESSGNSVSEMLENVRLKMSATSETETITDNLLGGSWWWGKCPSQNASSLDAVYDDQQRKWHSVGDNTNMSGTSVSKDSVKTAFENFYKPFKDKRGVWRKQTDSDNECSKLYAKQDLTESDEDFQQYSSFCYVKQTDS